MRQRKRWRGVEERCGEGNCETVEVHSDGEGRGKVKLEGEEAEARLIYTVDRSTSSAVTFQALSRIEDRLPNWVKHVRSWKANTRS